MTTNESDRKAAEDWDIVYEYGRAAGFQAGINHERKRLKQRLLKLEADIYELSPIKDPRRQSGLATQMIVDRALIQRKDVCALLERFFDAEGIEHERKRASKGGADGYCAWHPVYGLDIYGSGKDKESVEHTLTKGDLEDGWQVVPVKLLKMDEVK